MIDHKLDKDKLEEELDKLANSSVSRIMIQILEQKVAELDTLKGISVMKELLGRKYAVEKLKSIINRLQPKQNVDVRDEYK